MKTIAQAQIAPYNGRLVCWSIGHYLIGTWSGPPPKGAVRFRLGYLNLHTGQYQIPQPTTTMFNLQNSGK